MYLMLSEAIKTRAIEGDELDRESVRSSLLSWMTSETLSDNPDQKATGAACAAGECAPALASLLDI